MQTPQSTHSPVPHLWDLSDDRGGSVNCMQPWDWLEHWWGEMVSPPLRAIFHLNYYSLYCVLHMQYVPNGTLKMIWQQFGGCTMNIHIKAYIRRCTHECTLPCSHIPSVLLSLLTHPSFPLSFLKIQKCVKRGEANILWREDRSAEYFIKHFLPTPDLRPRNHPPPYLSSFINHHRNSCFISKHLQTLNI